MTKIDTIADVVAWLKKWEEDRAAGLVPADEGAHRRLVIEILEPFAIEEQGARAAVAVEREAWKRELRDALLGETNIRPGYALVRVRALLDERK